jgi:heat shock protein HslJ
MGGELRYMADAAVFTECRTGERYPVAFEADWIRAERAYLEADKPEPGAPVYATLEGKVVERPRMDGAGAEPTLVITRFIHLWPHQSCERARAEADLTGTYWRVVRLGGEPVAPVADAREPHLILRRDGRYTATAGCNRLFGGYAVAGGELELTVMASTRMACPPPLDALEQALGDALARTRGHRILAQTLELMDAGGESLALLEAVYLK